MISIWPSIIWICISVFGFGIKIEKKTYGWIDFIASLLIAGLLYWGGFFDPLIKAAA